MKKILRILKSIWAIDFARRIFNASKYFNKKYIQILRWGFKSKENTNYTYDLTDDNLLYLANVVAAVTKKDFKEILDYINEARNDDELKNHVIHQTQKSDFKKFADPRCDFGRRLGWYAFVRAIKPKVVVETGVDKGLGSVLLCSALLKNQQQGFKGQYFGTDINPDAGYLLSGDYAAVGKIIYGDSIKSLSDMNDSIDLFVNDSDHSADYEYKEYETINNLLSEKAIILGDNSHCSNKLAVFSNENGRRFLFFKEEPKDHWYPGAGIGISFK